MRRFARYLGVSFAVAYASAPVLYGFIHEVGFSKAYWELRLVHDLDNYFVGAVVLFIVALIIDEVRDTNGKTDTRPSSK